MLKISKKSFRILSFCALFFSIAFLSCSKKEKRLPETPASAFEYEIFNKKEYIEYNYYNPDLDDIKEVDALFDKDKKIVIIKGFSGQIPETVVIPEKIEGFPVRIVELDPCDWDGENVKKLIGYGCPPMNLDVLIDNYGKNETIEELYIPDDYFMKMFEEQLLLDEDFAEQFKDDKSKGYGFFYGYPNLKKLTVPKCMEGLISVPSDCKVKFI